MLLFSFFSVGGTVTNFWEVGYGWVGILVSVAFKPLTRDRD